MQPIFFDLDGTLISVEKRYYQIDRLFVEQHGGTIMPQAEYWALKREKIALPDFLSRCGCSAELIPSFKNYLTEEREKAENLKLDTVFSGVLDLLSRLKGKYHLYVVTLRRNEARLVEQLESLQLAPLLTKILTLHGEQEERWQMKVDLLKQHNLTGGEGYFVGDTETDIKTAQALGFRSIAVKNGMRSEAKLRAAGPDYLIESAAELEAALAPHSLR